MVRHPMAQMLSLSEGLTWALGWSAVAMIGAYLLNPVCVVIFLAGCALETVYLPDAPDQPVRILISGVKTSGAVAADLAVDPNPSVIYVFILFLLAFLMGNRGPEHTRRLGRYRGRPPVGAQTVPVRVGPHNAGDGSRFLPSSWPFSSNPALIGVSAIGFQPFFVLASLIAGAGLMLPPGPATV